MDPDLIAKLITGLRKPPEPSFQDMAIDYSLLAVGGAILALVYAVVLIYNVRSQNPGTSKMQEIASAVREGANAFLSREYRVIAPVAVIVAIVIYRLHRYPAQDGRLLPQWVSWWVPPSPLSRDMWGWR